MTLKREDRAEVWALHDGHCYCCGIHLDPFDRWHAVQGPKDTRVALCPVCNAIMASGKRSWEDLGVEIDTRICAGSDFCNRYYPGHAEIRADHFVLWADRIGGAS